MFANLMVIPILMVPFTYLTFRANFIPADHPALANKKLEPLDLNPKFSFYPNQQTTNNKHINNEKDIPASVCVYVVFSDVLQSDC